MENAQLELNARYRTPVVAQELTALFESTSEELRDSDLELARLKKLVEDSAGDLNRKQAAWEAAGRPNPSKSEVDTAAQHLNHAQSAHRSKSRSYVLLKCKVAYLRAAQFIRMRLVRSKLPVPMCWLIIGSAFFVLLMLIGWFTAKSVSGAILIGLAASTLAILFTALLQYVPTDAVLIDSTKATERSIRQRDNERQISRKKLAEEKALYLAVLSDYEIKTDFHAAHAAHQDYEQQYRRESEFNRDLRQKFETLRERVSFRRQLLSVKWELLTGIDFEQFLKDVFEELGYDVQTTKVTGDQGVDLILSKDGEKLAVQAKGYPNSTVGNDGVQQIHTGMYFYGCSKCMVVTNSRFTAAARQLASGVGCILIDESRIESLIRGEVAF